MKTYRVYVIADEKGYVDIVASDHDEIYDKLDRELYLEGIIDKIGDEYLVLDIEDISDDCFLED